MREIHRFEPEFARLLPASHALCQAAQLVVHDTVAQVFICGSRGLAGGSRPTSDIDLSLLVNTHELPPHEHEREQVLRSVLETTLSHWQGPVEADLAAIFDTFTCCGLRCFQTRTLDPAIVGNRGVDCFGIYKVQRGFNGYVRHGVEIAKVYPLLCIWNRPSDPTAIRPPPPPNPAARHTLPINAPRGEAAAAGSCILCRKHAPCGSRICVGSTPRAALVFVWGARPVRLWHASCLPFSLAARRTDTTSNENEATARARGRALNPHEGVRAGRLAIGAIFRPSTHALAATPPTKIASTAAFTIRSHPFTPFAAGHPLTVTPASAAQTGLSPAPPRRRHRYTPPCH